MVTQIKKESEALAKRANDRVTAAIKSRTGSFIELKQAAASSFLLAIQFGRFDAFNRLFTELANHPAGRIDADALRQRFVWQVVDTFGQGGIRPEATPDGEVKGWIKRPVAFVAYTEKDRFHAPTVNGKTAEAESKRKLIKAGKKAVIEAGEAGLEAIDWMSREAVIRGESTYDSNTFRKDISRVLQKALREMKSDPEIRIEMSTIRAIMRDAGFEKRDSAAINAMIEDVAANRNKPDEKKPDESGSELIKANQEKQAA